MFGSIEVVPPGAACDRSVGARREGAPGEGRDGSGPRSSLGEGSKKFFFAVFRVQLFEKSRFATGNGRKRKDFPASQERIAPSWTRSGRVLEASPTRAAGRPARKTGSREMAPQGLEIIKSAPGNGMASAASCPQDLVRGRSHLRRLSGRRKPTLGATLSGVASRAAEAVCAASPEHVIASEAKH